MASRLPRLLSTFQMVCVGKSDSQYVYKTKEVTRMNMHDLYLAKHASLLSDANDWTTDILHQGKLCISPSHWKKRLDGYHNQLSRNKRYIELTTPEWTLLQDINKWLSTSKPDFQVVEVGWNADGVGCKISVVLNIPPDDRYLFLCIGADAGIKTFYINPTFKYRGVYQTQKVVHTEEIPELAEDFRKLEISDKTAEKVG